MNVTLAMALFRNANGMALALMTIFLAPHFERGDILIAIVVQVKSEEQKDAKDPSISFVSRSLSFL